MDEFHKPYEYEEDNEVIWPVRIFCILLLSAEMFFSFIYLFQLNDIFGSTSAAGITALIFPLLYKAFILITVLFLFKIKKYAIKIVKSFLILRLIYFLASSIIVFVYNINDPNSFGADYGKFQSVSDIVIMLLVTPLAYAVGFSFSWFVYFIKSKKIKEVYNQK